jgi:hypothetical protein
MNDCLGWVTAGLIFLWILGGYDARAASADRGNVRCESPSQNASLPTSQALSWNGGVRAQTNSHFEEVIVASSWAGNESRGTEKGAR